jgi:hypothetical protein
MEVKTGMENFLVKAFEKFYITIWSYMKLERCSGSSSNVDV